jgi:hypothetical protein
MTDSQPGGLDSNQDTHSFYTQHSFDGLDGGSLAVGL